MKKVCLTQFKSLAEMRKALPTEKKCMAYLEKAMWPNGPVSPYAPTSKVYKRKDGTYRCRETGKNFNVKIRTIFENTKLPLITWFEAIYLLTIIKKGTSSLQLTTMLHVTLKTAWFLTHRIRECYENTGGKLDGEVELDETFVGGNCICPKCKQPLIAKNEGKTRQKHFAHQGEYGDKVLHTCHNYYITALHRLAEQIIRDRKSVMAPPYKDEIEAHRIQFVDVEVEERNDRADMQPDIVGITDKGLRCLIEIRNTNKISPCKKEKIINDGLVCMEIDVRDVKLEELEDFLLNSSEHRTWVNNPEYERILMEKMAKTNAENIFSQERNTSTISPVDDFLNKLRPNNGFDYNGLKTSVINYAKTISGNSIVVLHGDKLSSKLYMTLVSFPNGIIYYKSGGEFDNINNAELALAYIKNRY